MEISTQVEGVIPDRARGGEIDLDIGVRRGQSKQTRNFVSMLKLVQFCRHIRESPASLHSGPLCGVVQPALLSCSMIILRSSTS